MQSLKQHLIDAQRNDAVLFCGAGFSADCLNLSLDKIGTTSPLLQILNEHLGEPHFNDVSLAAQEFIDKIGE